VTVKSSLSVGRCAFAFAIGCDGDQDVGQHVCEFFRDRYVLTRRRCCRSTGGRAYVTSWTGKHCLLVGLVWLKPRPHQQQCRSNVVECYKSNDSFDKVETNWTRSICCDFVKRTKFYDKLVRHCCRFWQQSRTLHRHCRWCERGFKVTYGVSDSTPSRCKFVHLYVAVNDVTVAHSLLCFQLIFFAV